MPSSSSSTLDDKYSKGILLLAVVLFSWLLGIKNFVLDRTDTAEESQTSRNPNILMIVVDDLGYNDTSAINTGGLPTPNIQHLAREGVTFRRHYADATCTPSRVALLTGRYPERSGFRPVGIEIPAEFATIAEQLKGVGYNTYLTGKWHAGEERPQAWPENKGFDQWFGFLNQWELSGEVSDANKGGQKRPTYINPMLRENGGPLEQHNGHLTDILTDHTIAKLEELESQASPWFVYHAFLAPHHPIQPAQRYRDKFPATPEGEYTALVTQLDDAVGRILAAVDQANTLVIFVSDNGGTNKQRDNNYPFFGKKADVYEGAYRTPLILNWPGVIPKGKFLDDVVMNVDIYPTLLAAAHLPSPADLDGENLWPLMQSDAPLTPRPRSWEVFSENVNAMGFSFLSNTGEWRMASVQGLPPRLFHLPTEPSGEHDVASQHPDIITQLTSGFWQEYWDKSLIHASESVGQTEGQTLYSGFDVLRTPYLFGFAIGIEVGPLPTALTKAADQAFYVLAGQKDFWELRYRPTQGLEWQIGDTTLRDASFEPTQCNPIVLTGFFQPIAHLAKRSPRSQIKLYSAGSLRDYTRQFDYETLIGGDVATPTFVNYEGKATFSNMMLSSFDDSYEPRVNAEYLDIYTSLYKEKKLSVANVSMMDSELCN